VIERVAWWRTVFAITSVDTVSAAIYGGVLLAHLPALTGASVGWDVILSIVIVVLLFVIDRAESLRFLPDTTPTRVAISLLAVRIALMSIVVQLHTSTLAWFLFEIPAFRACLYFGSRVSYAIAGFTWLAFFLQHLQSWPDGREESILFAMGMIFVCTCARVIREERLSRQHGEDLLAELERSHKQLQAHAETVAELATTEERNRLARDIHDSLGHYLTVTNVQIAKALAFQYRDPSIAEQAMKHAKDTAHEALRAVRQSVGALRATRQAFVFGQALKALVERTQTDSCEIAVHTDGNEAIFAAETLTALYYVTQEALTNIQKHAHATEVSIDVAFLESEANLTIRDNGTGFQVAALEDTYRVADGGYGLHSMRDRLTRVGGRLVIDSHPGQGTTLTILAPRNLVAHAELPSNGAGRAVKA
jgi:signal transduction histidine kinase